MPSLRQAYDGQTSRPDGGARAEMLSSESIRTGGTGIRRKGTGSRRGDSATGETGAAGASRWGSRLNVHFLGLIPPGVPASGRLGAHVAARFSRGALPRDQPGELPGDSRGSGCGKRDLAFPKAVAGLRLSSRPRVNADGREAAQKAQNRTPFSCASCAFRGHRLSGCFIAAAVPSWEILGLPRAGPGSDGRRRAARYAFCVWGGRWREKETGRGTKAEEGGGN